MTYFLKKVNEAALCDEKIDLLQAIRYIARSFLKGVIMARVTVEDCLEETENRFGLVHLAAKRTKELLKGSRAVYQCKNREVVTSLREIADGSVHPVRPGDELIEGEE